MMWHLYKRRWTIFQYDQKINVLENCLVKRPICAYIKLASHCPRFYLRLFPYTPRWSTHTCCRLFPFPIVSNPTRRDEPATSPRRTTHTGRDFLLSGTLPKVGKAPRRVPKKDIRTRWLGTMLESSQGLSGVGSHQEDGGHDENPR